MSFREWLQCKGDLHFSGFLNFCSVLSHPIQSSWRFLRLLSHDPDTNDVNLFQNFVLGLPDRVAEKYRQELDYLISHPNYEDWIFPYPVADRASVSDDSEARSFRNQSPSQMGKFPCVIHKGHPFFGEPGKNQEEVEKAYRYYVEDEGLLGTGRRIKSPHAYVDSEFSVEPGDVVVDIGCSDGLFAFDHAEVAGKIYLFESLPMWRKTLERSFAPFREKTKILTKLVSDQTTRRSVRLSDAIQEPAGTRYFLKMDIEGWERTVLEASRDFLQNNRVKLSCCVYHRQDDAEVISAFLKNLGYRYRFSDGYMLPMLGKIQFPYFRRGMIYARND